MRFYIGLDLSLAGTGAVCLSSNGIEQIMFFTSKKSDLKRHKDALNVHAILSPEVSQDDPIAMWRRTVSVADEVLRFVNGCRTVTQERDVYVAIEDHAFGAKGASVYQLGHLHGLVRYGLNSGGVLCNTIALPFRLYEPTKVKKYATGSGAATKEAMIIAAEKHGFACTQYGSPAQGNLADAYWLARLLQLEVDIREGRDTLDQKTGKIREIFEGTSKKPGLLDQPFIDFTAEG